MTGGYLGHLICGWWVQTLVDAGGHLRVSILGLQLAIALAAMAQALPVPYLLVGLTAFPHSKPLGCVPRDRERRGWIRYQLIQSQTARTNYVKVTQKENIWIMCAVEGKRLNTAVVNCTSATRWQTGQRIHQSRCQTFIVHEHMLKFLFWHQNYKIRLNQHWHTFLNCFKVQQKEFCNTELMLNITQR